ncbi:YeiH family protein [Corynebacterium lubricantis]|uniref:YeiH family protein n=1 Tax=Corynebacterium lubricantis TaxID=541095 RepID=UPI00035E7A28|nr:putative sulfate exporter family transporter [Corynebacterium lubricantis]
MNKIALAKQNSRLRTTLPGVLVATVAAVAAWVIARFLPGISALLIAIVLGALWSNLAPVPAVLDRGIAFSSKSLLRAGIVLLGFQLSLSAILDLGVGVLLIVIAAVGVTFMSTLWVGKLLGISLTQRVLIASGFSICGAAAVAAMDETVKAKREEVATAVGLVVLFGTIMIPLVPFLGGALGLSEHDLGIWIGASTHEVAQVVAAGGAVGGAALGVAVTVKLARVLMLAPVIAGVSWTMKRSGQSVGKNNAPIVPLFIVGFIVAMLVRTTGIVPESVLGAIQIAQTLLLSAAMFALGLGLNFRALIKVGAKPVILGLISTGIIMSVALAGVFIQAYI